MDSADICVVKKVIIALVNATPGILVEKLNQEYRANEGCAIQYASFGYKGLLAFLENELIENVRISFEGLNIRCYPIANEKSGHIVKYTEDPKRNIPRTSNPRFETILFEFFSESIRRWTWYIKLRQEQPLWKHPNLVVSIWTMICLTADSIALNCLLS